MSKATGSGNPQSDTPALVTLGEAMAVVGATVPGPFANGAPMRLGWAGAEATVAVGVSRLGHRAAWTGRVGEDSAGAMILAGLRAEGVDVSGARIDPEAATGMMLRERRTADRLRVSYYRAGLAGSRLAPADLDERQIAAARILHVTGITPALSATARAAVEHAVRAAHAAGVTVSLDVNHRELLWSRADAAEVLGRLLPYTNLVFAGTEEAALLVPEDDPQEMARALTLLGPEEAVLKLGSEGALTVTGDGTHTQAAIPVTAVDPVGAGDAFVSGYLAAVLDGSPVPGRLRLAALCGAFAVSVPGDWEGIPHRTELGLLAAQDIVR
ncbi:PfkB domain containing protein [Streptomyces venezuelae]|uniref:sugar kinase n=1 Tax=Streptomyces gardneri TaxID=66892 RepID=UPI0006BD79AC|nr:sugar kinase [Streptomyces gardneri]ALO12428.1 PfkB domain containing protein [Streptomyces venezuelae]QPK49207.1 sugar kinase [Streptomyces gardneri]WRK40714.1 sugar kinase [Streptomyces venezuelae]CUM36957.1 2-dehydro-3-deoxygluconate kinase [Streptomyces venezuelae]